MRIGFATSETPAPRPAKHTPRASSSVYPTDFEEFWKAYPRHDDKGMAYAQYKARLAEGYKADDIAEAAKHYGADCERKGTEQCYIKLAKTFLGCHLPFVEWIKAKEQTGGKAKPEYTGEDDLDELFGSFGEQT